MQLELVAHATVVICCRPSRLSPHAHARPHARPRAWVLDVTVGRKYLLLIGSFDVRTTRRSGLLTAVTAQGQTAVVEQTRRRIPNNIHNHNPVPNHKNRNETILSSTWVSSEQCHQHTRLVDRPSEHRAIRAGRAVRDSRSSRARLAGLRRARGLLAPRPAIASAAIAVDTVRAVITAMTVITAMKATTATVAAEQAITVDVVTTRRRHLPRSPHVPRHRQTATMRHHQRPSRRS